MGSLNSSHDLLSFCVLLETGVLLPVGECAAVSFWCTILMKGVGRGRLKVSFGK